MRILIATDFSKHADRAIECVKGMSLPEGSHVRVVHAIEPVTTVAIFAPAALLTASELVRDETRAIVRDVARKIERPGVRSDGIIGYGRAADVVCDEAHAFEPDLIVVGSRGRGAIATNVLGSVSAELIDRSPCPVLVARVATLGRIILAEDGSSDAAAGAKAITELVPFRAASVRVVTVVDLPYPMVLADPTGTTTAVNAFRDYQTSLVEMRSRSETLAHDRSVTLSASGLASTWERREGDAAYELLAAADSAKADCIVVGTRGQTGVKRLVLGSVARSVLYHAPCSVLVAHATQVKAKAGSNGKPALAIARKEVTT